MLNIKQRLLTLTCFSLLVLPARAQEHDHDSHHTMTHSGTHSGHSGEVMQLMNRARTLGSGTSLIPATSAMRMWDLSNQEWLWMLHGDFVGGYNQQSAPRGTQAWAAENWLMMMASRNLGPGILDLRLMGSLEALTLPAGGTPQLFQSGESYQGKALVDKQHPHDLLMELAARYSWQIDPDWNLFGYAGLVGEPALGPSAFMHRPSSADNHWAPLAHHLQDATHISFGVGTLGLRWQQFQLEGSLFNGREPDENRFNFDFGPLDSWSTRLSWIPGPNWVAQISYGQLKNPEALTPGDVHRSTASVSHVLPLNDSLLSSSLIWGMNQEFHEEAQVLHSLGLESQYDWNQQQNHVYGRLEWVDKNNLQLSAAHDHALHKVLALTLGGIHDLVSNEFLQVGLGADATVSWVDADVQAVYGQVPYGFRAYVRLRPPVMPPMPES